MSKQPLQLLVLPSIQNIDEISLGLNVELTKAYYSKVEFIVKDNLATIKHLNRNIKEFEYVWLSSFWASRDLAHAVGKYLEFHETPTTYVEEGTSKISDSIIFALNNINTPNTYYIENLSMTAYLKQIEATCGYPMIMKDTKGCGGVNTTFIATRASLIIALESRDLGRKYLLQSFIHNDYDWGVMVANGVVVSAERSYPPVGEFRNNVGATEVFVDVSEVPEEIKNMALAGSACLGLNWSRSDIVIERGTDRPYLLEVNRFPGITAASEEVIGARKFLAALLPA